MMLFEEFFKKKKIDLTALQKGERELFTEFKDHYEQMGEKSFDHTKKYWFNKLRRQFPLAAEVKAERLRPENQIAEQTVADTLTEPSITDNAPKLGFKPKFKTATPVVKPPAAETPQSTTESTETPATAPAKVGFKPRFKPGVTAPAKPAEEQAESATVQPNEVEAVATPPAEVDTAPEQPAPKIGFKPRFKAGVTSNKPVEEVSATPPVNEVKAVPPTDKVEEVQQVTPAPKMGFKPRFKAGVTTNKPAEDIISNVAPVAENAKTEVADITASPEPVVEPAKLGFKPRFKAGVTNTKLTEEATIPQESEIIKQEAVAPAEELPSEEEPTAKQAYKPRFTPNMIRRKPPEGE